MRHFARDLVSKAKIELVLDIARYVASRGYGQPVQWLVVHDSNKVHRIAGLAAAWMKTLINTPHPMSGYVPGLIAAWEAGHEVICLGPPHLLFAHTPEGNPVASTDAIIALAHFDIAVQASWRSLRSPLNHSRKNLASPRAGNPTMR